MLCFNQGEYDKLMLEPNVLHGSIRLMKLLKMLKAEVLYSYSLNNLVVKEYGHIPCTTSRLEKNVMASIADFH